MAEAKGEASCEWVVGDVRPNSHAHSYYATTGNGLTFTTGNSTSGWAVSITPEPEPPKTEVESLLAEVEAVCLLGR